MKIKKVDSKISIIIPTYNRGNLICNSIKSVLNQTYKNFEVIVVDDGSIDNTREQIEKIKDNRIKYIKLYKNRGASNARNIGISQATGKYISFQDSDDVYYPDKLEKQIKNMFNMKSNFDFCKIKVFVNDSFSKFYPNSRQEKSIREGNILKELITYGNFISTQSILVKKNLLKKYFFDINLPRLQDFDIILRMFPKTKISYTKNVLVELHMQSDSITLSNIRLEKAIDILIKKKFNFNSEEKKLFSNYLNQTLNVLINKKKSYK